MSYSNLLNRLKNHTNIILKSSSVHGIGVFALQTIPKGSRDIFSKGIRDWLKVPFSEVETLPEHARLLIETYCLFDEKNYFVPEHGFNIIDPVIYLNHSSQPNIISINDGEIFETLIDINPGEELLIDYGDIAEGMENYK